jgi:pimeloyl-ACP methyl ester carboxylesterase
MLGTVDATWSASTISVGGVKLRCYELGQGEPLLLLHGIGAGARTWGRAAEALALRRRVIAPDARGHGRSEKPATGYREIDYVADAEALAAQAGDQPLDVVGHSLGGRIAAGLAARRPDAVRRLVLYEAVGAPATPRSPAQEAQMREGARVWIERLRAAPREAVLEQTRQRQPAWSEEERAAFIDSQRELSMAVYGQEAIGYFWDWRQAVADIRSPTLALFGDRTAASFPPSIADQAVLGEVQAAMPRARVVQVRGAGHMVHLDRTWEFVAAVESFLD